MKKEQLLFSFFERQLSNLMDQKFQNYRTTTIDKFVKNKKTLAEIKQDFKNSFELLIIEVNLDENYNNSYFNGEYFVQEFKFITKGDSNILLYSPNTNSNSTNPPLATIYKDYIIIKIKCKKDDPNIKKNMIDNYQEIYNYIKECLEEQKKEINSFININIKRVVNIYNNKKNEIESKKKLNEDIQKEIFKNIMKDK